MMHTLIARVYYTLGLARDRARNNLILPRRSPGPWLLHCTVFTTKFVIARVYCTSGLARDRARNRVLLPTLGSPTSPTSAMLFTSSMTTALSPACPTSLSSVAGLQCSIPLLNSVDHCCAAVQYGNGPITWLPYFPFVCCWLQSSMLLLVSMKTAFHS